MPHTTGLPFMIIFDEFPSLCKIQTLDGNGITVGEWQPLPDDGGWALIIYPWKAMEAVALEEARKELEKR